MMKKNFRSMRKYTIAVLVTAAACLASGCAKKEVSVEVVSGLRMKTNRRFPFRKILLRFF